MEGDLIFTSTDPLFNMFLHITDELNRQKRLIITNVQTCQLKEAIQSDNGKHVSRFTFGGDEAQAFGRTASAVFRMVMLKAVRINEEFWPSLGYYSMSRNRDGLQFNVVTPKGGEGFQLTNDKEAARWYWSKYDHIFPHFLIENKVLKEKTAFFQGMMFIFKNDFQEMIEITTNANATKKPDGVFGSSVHVTCIRREIKKGKDLAEFKRFKKLVGEVNIKEYAESVEEFEKEKYEDEDEAFGALNSKLAKLSTDISSG